MALEAGDAAVPGAGSQLGWLLWAGALAGAARGAARAAVRARHPHAFGLRTLSPSDPVFDPQAYHRGSIWPFDSWLGWGGLRAAGLHAEAERVRTGVLAALDRLGQRAGALRGRARRRARAGPAANRVQAWTSARAGRSSTLGRREFRTEPDRRALYRSSAMPPFKLDAVYSPTADQPKAIAALARGHRARGPRADAAGRHRHRQDDDDGGHDRGRPAAGADHRPQQDARRAALQRVPDVLPDELGRVLRLLLRLLPARGLRPVARTSTSRRTRRSTRRSTGCATPPRRRCSPAAT